MCPDASLPPDGAGTRRVPVLAAQAWYVDCRMSNTKRTQKAAQAQRARRQQQPTSPKGSSRTWLLVGGVIAVVAILVAIVLSGVESKGPSGIPEGTDQVAVPDPAHIEGAIEYPVLVPAGGPHNPEWLNCGYYSETVRPENAVHSLEHAAVWVTVRPDAGQETLDELRDLVGRRDKLIVSPVAGQVPLVMATAWGYQLELESADDPRLQQFLNEFEGTIGYAPEPQGICFGGVGSPE